MQQWYPLKLTVHVRSYPFGERLIPEMLGKTALPEGRVAETWEISDYRETTGAVRNGAFAGHTLHDLVTQYPDALVGRGWRGPHFPLLEKFLDASHMLPVHLHADNETARRVYHEPNGKTEAWHILWAAPDATILAGIKPDVSRPQLVEAFKAQEYRAVMPEFPIQSGDTVYVPAGVLHSFGPNTLIFEVQQTSDLTNTVMPVDLFGNRLSEEQWDKNIATVLDELRTHYQPRPNPGLPLPGSAENHFRICCAGPHFVLERWVLSAPHTQVLDGRHAVTLASTGAPVRLDYRGGTDTLARGESCILPAALGEVTISPLIETGAPAPADLIACYVPNLQLDVLARLRAAGIGEGEIHALGEV
jgi:mannose-6-phosphate isomerase